MSNIEQIVKELKKRKVFRSIAIYAAFAFILIQVCAIVFPALHLPNWTMTFLVVMLLIGFPATLVLSWIYDITPSDKTEEIPPTGTDDKTSLGIYALIGLVIIVISTVLWLTLGVKKIPEKEVSRKSIAVLYFDAHSPDIETEFWCSGMTEEVITALAKLGSFDVKSRTDVLQFKGREKDSKEIKKQLNVDAYLEGSLQRSKNRIRITAQLIDANTGLHIWLEKYDRPIDDILNVQDEISQKIATTLGLKLADIQEDVLEAKTTDNVKAFDFSSQGIYYFDRKMYNESLTAFNKAIINDPSFSKPNYYIGLIHQLKGQHNKAIDAFKKALPKSDKFSRTLWKWENIIKEDIRWTYFENEMIAIGRINDIDDEYDRIIVMDLNKNKIRWQKDFHKYKIGWSYHILGESIIIKISDRKEIDPSVDGEGFMSMDIHSGNINYEKFYEKKDAEKFNISLEDNYGYLNSHFDYKEKLDIYENMLFCLVRRDTLLQIIRINPQNSDEIWSINIPISQSKDYNSQWISYSTRSNNLPILLNISSNVGRSKGEKPLKIILNSQTGMLIKEYFDTNNTITFMGGEYLVQYYKDSTFVDFYNPDSGELEWRYNTQSSIFITRHNTYPSPFLLVTTQDEIISISTENKLFNYNRINWKINVSEKIESINIGSYEDQVDREWIAGVSGNGYVIILNKDNGQVISELELHNKKLHYTRSYHDELFLYTEDHVLKINPYSGDILWELDDFQGIGFSWMNDFLIGNNLLVKKDKQIMSIHKDYGTLLWSYMSSSHNRWSINDMPNVENERLFIGDDSKLVEINLKQNPESKLIEEKEILTQLSLSLVETDGLKQAEEYLIDVTESLDPSYSDAYWILADLYKKKKDKFPYINALIKCEILSDQMSLMNNNIIESLKENAGLQWYNNINGDNRILLDGKDIINIRGQGWIDHKSVFIQSLNKNTGKILWEIEIPREGYYLFAAVDSTSIYISYHSWSTSPHGVVSINRNNGKINWINDIGKQNINILFWGDNFKRQSFAYKDIFILNKYATIYAFNKIDGKTLWKKEGDFIDSYENDGRLFLIYTDSLQIVNIQTGITEKKIDIIPSISGSNHTPSKVFDNNFIYYAKKDSSFTSLNLKTEKNNVSIKSILNEHNYVGTVMNDIIIERDKDRLVAWLPDLTNTYGYRVLWDIEINGINYIIGKENILKVTNEDEMIIYVDILTGNVMSEFYSLWDGYEFYDNGILYIGAKNYIYAITPNTEW